MAENNRPVKHGEKDENGNAQKGNARAARQAVRRKRGGLRGLNLFDVIVRSDCVERGVTPGTSISEMTVLYSAIRRAKEGYDPSLLSRSGMVGGDGAKMRK